MIVRALGLTNLLYSTDIPPEPLSEKEEKMEEGCEIKKNVSWT